MKAVVPWGGWARDSKLAIELEENTSKTGQLEFDADMPCVETHLSSTSARLSDTVAVSFSYTRTDGIPGSFRPDQQFSVFIGSNDSLGLLYSSDGQSGTDLFGALQPLSYIAPDSLSGDSLVVQFFVVPVSTGVAAVAAGSPQPLPAKTFNLNAFHVLAENGLCSPGKLVITKSMTALSLTVGESVLFPTLISTPSENEGNNNRINVFVSTTLDGIPMSGQEIEVQAEGRIPSGGHIDHPPFPADQKGKFIWNNNEGNPLLVLTNNLGYVDNLFYQAGEFSITIEISAKHIESSSKQAVEKEISVYPLRQLTGGLYDLKAIESDIQKMHPSPYWIVDGLHIVLDSVAQRYNNLFLGNSKLVITDASLIHGGKYEVAGNWEGGGHKFHRLGLDVDMRSTSVLDDDFNDVNDNGTLDQGESLTIDHNHNGKLDLNRTELINILEDWIPRPVFEPTKKDVDGNIVVFEHFHLYFWN